MENDHFVFIEKKYGFFLLLNYPKHFNLDDYVFDQFLRYHRFSSSEKISRTNFYFFFIVSELKNEARA